MIHQDIHYTAGLTIRPSDHQGLGGYSTVKVVAKLEDGTDITTVYYLTAPYSDETIKIEPITGRV